MRISRSVMAVVGAVLAAVMIGFTNPKAVHAVAAALVQVTNTASNPVVNSEVTISPSQIVDLDCATEFGAVHCLRVEPGGAVDADPYVVPAGQALVITDLDILTNTALGNGLVVFDIASLPHGAGTKVDDPILEVVPNSGTSYHFNFSRGVVFPSGASFFSVGTLGIGAARLHGYLAPNI